MKKILLLIFIFSLFSCNEDYDIISESDLEKLVIQDTLINNPNHLVMTVGKSITDEYPKLLVKKTRLYLFDRDYEIKNDSTILSYDYAFLIDSKGSFRENGIWIYARFDKEGYFPFSQDVINFSVDSIPADWNKRVPTTEGIYFYENDSLRLHSKQQSAEKFKEKKKSGFYFIPNKGRLFNKTNVNRLK